MRQAIAQAGAMTPTLQPDLSTGPQHLLGNRDALALLGHFIVPGAKHVTGDYGGSA